MFLKEDFLPLVFHQKDQPWHLTISYENSFKLAGTLEWKKILLGFCPTKIGNNNELYKN
jgi:hypothetical protein